MAERRNAAISPGPDASRVALPRAAGLGSRPAGGRRARADLVVRGRVRTEAVTPQPEFAEPGKLPSHGGGKCPVQTSGESKTHACSPENHEQRVTSNAMRGL